ncbi:precorrin-4 C(11)-methyltransferase [Caldalkalibacillus thermarum TA2.A1]|uniref:Precorrin-4 C(11)-methyltransferase n=1 Tax=Caldalkalibacillus thermarum (strain TA2.A1) TaxID=986075 RepID=A0A8X8I3S7_CALTT|nr:precorrin-4 C(11)-methyltransferase [Caldalkalibacillus thermarum]QZT33831.1 precorrin-4 C(11)-methyltransferase [Caldalkalibacillus thermarum TA2.A1]
MKVYIIGAGPGDPELITVKGLNILRRADVVMYTDSLVSERLIAEAKPEAEVIKSAGLTLEEMMAMMIDAVRQGKVVARIHTGDPAVFGAVMEQIIRLKQAGIPYEIIPGVSSVFAAAAALGAELTIPELTQTVILTRTEGRTPMPEREKLKDLARHHCTLALFLSATLAKKVVQELKEAGWRDETPVAVVYKASWPDQKVIRTNLRDLPEAMRRAGVRSQAMILAGWALEPDHERLAAYRCKLYDPAFTHGYRQGVKQC